MKMKTILFELLSVVFAFITFLIITPALAGPINIKGSGTNDAKVKIDAAQGDYPSVNFLNNGTQIGVVGWHRTEDAMKFLYATTLGSSNGITLKANGNVGIGTTNPRGKLDVFTISLGFGGAFLGFNTYYDDVDSVWRNKSNGEAAVIRLGAENQEEGGDIQFITFNTNNNGDDSEATGFSKRLVIKNSGNVGIGTTNPAYPLEMASGAHVTTAGVWTDASSRDYKENIRDLTYDEAKSALSELTPSKFNYKIDKEDEYLGFIAEDVPDLVATKDRKGLSPMDIVAVLTKVVQKQQEIVERQQEELVRQKEDFTRKIDALKNLLSMKQ